MPDYALELLLDVAAQGGTNLTWIHVGSGDDPGAALEAMLQRLREARAAGVEATLSIEPFLFRNLRGDLRPDGEIEDFLVELRARIEFEGLLDTVALIYPKDEPFRQFIRYRDPSFYDQYVTGEVYAEIHQTLVHPNGLIKLAFPDKPIGVILSGYDIFHKFFSIPENYDWVGFDCYADLFKACDGRSFVDFYQRLLDYMQPHQRLNAVPETWVQNDFLGRADWPDILWRRLRHHCEIALSERRFVAFVPFIWSFEADGEVPGVGLDRFPELFDDGDDDSGSRLVAAVMAQFREVRRILGEVTASSIRKLHGWTQNRFGGFLDISGIWKPEYQPGWASEYPPEHYPGRERAIASIPTLIKQLKAGGNSGNKIPSWLLPLCPDRGLALSLAGSDIKRKILDDLYSMDDQIGFSRPALFIYVMGLFLESISNGEQAGQLSGPLTELFFVPDLPGLRPLGHPFWRRQFVSDCTQPQH